MFAHIVVVAGLVSIVAGCAMVSPALACVVGGVFLVLIGAQGLDK